MSSSKRILWSANDPGGANAVMPVIEALLRRGDEVVGVVTGPALEITQQKKLPVALESPWRPDLFLAGTSGTLDSVDKQLLRTLRNAPSVYVMDFWNNYRMRFAETLPTRLCVIDEPSKRAAIAEGLPAESLVVTGNPHFDHFADRVTRDHEDHTLLLFISQPIRADDGGKYGFDEYRALEDVIASLPPGYRLGIRLHPRDNKHQFDAYLNNRVFVTEGTLEETLSRAGLVIGMFSPVLIQAAVAGKAVLSYEPGLIGEDPLPTNQLGLTHCVHSVEELSTEMESYHSGARSHSRADISMLWPPGATKRVVQVVDSLL